MELETNVLHIEFTVTANFQPLSLVGLLHSQYTSKVTTLNSILRVKLLQTNMFQE